VATESSRVFVIQLILNPRRLEYNVDILALNGFLYFECFVLIYVPYTTFTAFTNRGTIAPRSHGNWVLQ